MLLETIYKSFKHVVCFDTEFRGDLKEKGEHNDVVCFVYKDLKNRGKIIKTHGKSLEKLPFPNKETLFIAHHAGAETHSMLSMKMGRPKYIWDTMIEDKKLYFGRVRGHGLLSVANRYQVPGVISEDLKKYYIDLILSKEKYSKKELEKILNYCLSDVLTLEKVFLKQLKDLEKQNKLKGPREIISQALFSGWAMAATAQIEFTGIPINNPLLEKIREHYPKIRKTLINDINKKIDVYDETYTFKLSKFEAFVKRLGLYSRWPKTRTGLLRTDEETIFRFAQENKEINEFYFVDEFVESQKLKGFVVGPDGRARTPLWMYGQKTGRTNQSTATYPFNCSKPLRNIIKADPNKILVNFDYKNQEIAIAAYLSGDPQLMAAVDGDPYIKTAQMHGVVPDGATKDTHPVERGKYKVALLATLYGQGIKNMSAALGLSIDEGTELQVKIKKTYHVYFAWIKRIVDKSIVRGFMTAKFGFRYWIQPGEKFNPRTIFNYPIQTNGSEMLRLALIKLCNVGIEVNGPIHDGILMQFPRKQFRKKFIKAKRIMEDASKKILNKNGSTDYVCGVDWQLIRHAMIQKPDEQEKWERIMSLVNKYTHGRNTEVHR